MIAEPLSHAIKGVNVCLGSEADIRIEHRTELGLAHDEACTC
jgi:hypothetical protein